MCLLPRLACDGAVCQGSSFCVRRHRKRTVGFRSDKVLSNKDIVGAFDICLMIVNHPDILVKKFKELEDAAQKRLANADIAVRAAAANAPPAYAAGAGGGSGSVYVPQTSGVDYWSGGGAAAHGDEPVHTDAPVDLEIHVVRLDGERGIGLTLEFNDDVNVVVKSISPTGAASRCGGFLPGDVIVRVDRRWRVA